MSAERLRVSVPDDAAGGRLDRFLATVLASRTRSGVRRLVDDGRVRIDGTPAAKAGLALRAGMVVEVDIPSPEPTTLRPEDIPIPIVHEDADVIVVDKPAGLVVHPGHGHRTGTLVHALLGLGVPLAPAGGAERPGIVHRLDRETSGLIVVAKTDAAHRALSRAFAERTVRKTYLALVWGRPSPADGTIDRPIGRSRNDRTRMAVGVARGRAALTVFRTLERLPGATLLEIDLRTGRTHQIRVHLSSLGHAIVGDGRYGGNPWRRMRPNPVRDALREFGRVALHAARLAFVHPVLGETLEFHAPLPPDFETLLARFRGPS